jgi:1-deoxy-D-xylulose-5-phosphate synthase
VDLVSILEGLREPAQLRELSAQELTALAAEIREFLVEMVPRTGGHFGPNLGVVELTIAMHRAFDSPRDALLYDVGHQSYVHKLLTGRMAEFAQLRQWGGISGYPSRAESEHDFVENSHASTALSYADGLAHGFQLRGERRHAVALVGDGALTGGMCWEALNNIAADPERPVVIVVNDNGRSYSPTIGGFADHLATLRLRPGYETLLEGGKQALLRTPVVGKSVYAALHAAKRGLKDVLAPQAMFEDLGLKYIGPVDGHDLVATEQALRLAKDFGGPVIVHAVTNKGHGHAPAFNDEADQMHQVSPPSKPKKPTDKPTGKSWTSVFSSALVEAGRERKDIVAITAAMLESTGLAEFAKENPDRWVDVGIAEQHAMTSAAGLAMAGFHPVVAIYATFMNRAFDQLLMDVALHKQPVTVVLDRAGITGPDGSSHHGMWDLSLLGLIPGIRVAAPRDGATVREEFAEALQVSDGPTALRFSRGNAPLDIPAVRKVGGVDVLVDGGAKPQVLIVAVGAFAQLGLEVAEGLAKSDIAATVVDPRWVFPVPTELAELARAANLVVSLEDNGRQGGFGSALAATLRDAEVDTPLRDFAIAQAFHPHGSREQVLEHLGLTAEEILIKIKSHLG